MKLFICNSKYFWGYLFLFFIFFIGKLHMRPMGHEPMTSPFTLLQREKVLFGLKLIGKYFWGYL
jgi:hypothetical protein